MARALVALEKLIRNDAGQDLLEYGLVAVLIAIAAMLAVKGLGDTITHSGGAPLLTASETTAVLTVAVTGAGGAAIDMWTRRVPNPLTLGTAAFGVLLAASHQTDLSVAQAVAGFGLGILLMLPAYIFGATGGGDVKLFAAYGTLLGPRTIGFAFIYTAIAGGVLATMVALWRRSLRATLQRAAVLVSTSGANVAEIEHAATNNRFAYAPAIALGALVAALGR